MNSPLRLVFLGSDPIALPLLEWLDGAGRAHATVAAMFTQPDRPVGRGQKVQPNAIKAWALARRLPVLQPEKLTPAVQAELAAGGYDVALVMAYGHILRDEFIAAPRLGTLNLHTSILPKLRGASPIQTAVALGERETGVTLMRIVRKLDAGPIADVERVAIGRLDTAADIEMKLSRACVPLLARALPQIATGTQTFTEQDDASATYCRKLEKADGVLDFRASAAALAARINGLFPWPSCAVEIAAQPVKIGQAEALPEDSPPNAAPGQVLAPDADGLRIATGQGILRLCRLQRPGGKMLPAADFLRGFSVTPGAQLPSQPMPPLLAPPPAPRTR